MTLRISRAGAWALTFFQYHIYFPLIIPAYTAIIKTRKGNLEVEYG